MEMNLSPESLWCFIVGSALIAWVCVSIVKQRGSPLKAARLFNLTWLLCGLYFFIDAVGVLLLEFSWNVVATSVLFVSSTTLLMLLVNNTTDSYNSPFVTLHVAFGVLYHVVLLQPGAIFLGELDGIPTYRWSVAGDLVIGIHYVLMCIYISVFGITTWRVAPYTMRRPATMVLVGVILSVPVNLILFFFRDVVPMGNVLSFFFVSTGVFLFILATVQEPRFFFILPFTLFKLVVLESDGREAFSYDWKKLEHADVDPAPILTAIKDASNRIGSVPAITMMAYDGGNCIIDHAGNHHVLLFASRSSNVIRDVLHAFTKDLASAASPATPLDHATCQSLVKKHFEPFPSYMIRGKNQPINVFPGKGPRNEGTCERFKEIMNGDDSLNMVRDELKRAPDGVVKDVCDLYDELKDEIDDEE